jgi:Cap4 SAVED domain
MDLFDEWCSIASEEDRRKRLLKLAEKSGGRPKIEGRLVQTVRAHYDSLDQIANDVADLGYGAAATILRERLPRTTRARSGELAEILATEFTEARLNFNVPVRRLRYKDGREMALRGDDFIGVGYDEDDAIWLLKGESKSRKTLGKSTVAEAREALNRENGRCTPSSLLFVADRLLEGDDEEVELGRAIRKEVGTKTLPPKRIDHVIFTLSGNDAIAALKEDLQAAATGRNQTSVNILIGDHQEFIASVYEKAGDLGDD